jgi:hypothetical protein
LYINGIDKNDKDMTNEQRNIFSKLLDANWEADNTSNDYLTRDAARQDYYDLKMQLIESMGLEEYNKFVNIGRQMFA